MNVKFCDACKERIDGKYFEIFKLHTSGAELTFLGERPWPRDVHPEPACIIAALTGQMEE